MRKLQIVTVAPWRSRCQARRCFTGRYKAIQVYLRQGDFMAKVQPLETTRGGSPTRALAEFVAGFAYKTLPSEVVSHIKFCLLDSLGCALFGSTLPRGKIITSFTKELGKGKGALIW